MFRCISFYHTEQGWITWRHHLEINNMIKDLDRFCDISFTIKDLDRFCDISFAICNAFCNTVVCINMCLRSMIFDIKDVKELSWMSHRVIRFWFLLIFFFISAFFDILASLSISRVFSSGFSGRPKSSCLDIPRTMIKCDYIN